LQPPSSFDGTIPATSEVSALTVRAQMAGLGAYTQLGARLLAEMGLATVDDEAWIPTATSIDCMCQIRRTVGDKIMRQIGMEVPKHHHWPTAVSDVHSALASVDAAYQMAHRHGDVGVYAYTPTGDRSGEMLCRNPYLCPLDEGIITAVARWYGPLAVVTHGPDECRDRGDLQCLFQIRW
jgi:hypothetical protein